MSDKQEKRLKYTESGSNLSDRIQPLRHANVTSSQFTPLNSFTMNLYTETYTTYSSLLQYMMIFSFMRFN